MSDRRSPDGVADLETALADLATAVAFPSTPDLAAVVGVRLRAPQLSGPRSRPGTRSLRRSLLLAAALVLLAVGAALAVRLGLDLLSIETGPIPTESSSPSAPAVASPAISSPAPALGAGLGLGSLQRLDEARAAAPFEIRVPAALGPPDAIYIGGADLRGQVSFVYAADDVLPASSLLGGAGLLVTQNEGEADEGLASKLVDAGLASIEPVVIDGARGIWIGGEPHVFWYLAPDGAVLQGSRRLVGDTLIWERDDVLYRIEGAIPRERAMEIAASMR